jgi:hypothetical protein
MTCRPIEVAKLIAATVSSQTLISSHDGPASLGEREVIKVSEPTVS